MKKTTILFGIILFASIVKADSFSQNVSVTGGKIQGIKIKNTVAWLGIPFAEPPIGKLRWQPPQKVIPWQGIKYTTHYGNDCLQKPFNQDSAKSSAQYNEDCLTINVWRPSHTERNLPVMVWIYGGGFVNGGASPLVYSGQQFAKNNVVFVSFNYRVGRFGFFAHPALSKAPLRGNYGFMDQLAALKWVQENIGVFGGDKYNITVLGESAGGMSIHSLLTYPQSRGLFHKAIIQSGSGRHNLIKGQSWERAEVAGLKFAAQQGITGVSSEALKELRQLPAKNIVGDLNIDTMFNETFSGPMIDGVLITGEPQHFYERGQFIRVPILVGTNSEEISFASKVKTRDEALSVFPREDKLLAEKLFSGLSPQQIASQIEEHKLMHEPARFVARVWNKNQLPVWNYRFNYVAQVMDKKWALAPHASEIPYIFNSLHSKFGANVTEKDQAVSNILHQYWVNFAKQGNPNSMGLPKWQEYTSQSDKLLYVPREGAKQIEMCDDPLKLRLDLIEKINQ